ncbi:MAG: hypothetical protein WDO24_20060 [Pseudomonadota bacterium]
MRRQNPAQGRSAKTYLLRTFGNAGHQLFDVSDPAKPVKISEIMGLHGTHKNWWGMRHRHRLPGLRRA